MINLDGLRPWGGLAVEAAPADAVVAGIPYDGAAVYRRGAAQAPEALRRLSAAMPPLTESGRSLLGRRVLDLGDLYVGAALEVGWPDVAERLASIPPDALLTVLGGDHTVDVPILAAQARRHPGLAVAWIDAHPDLCDWSRGGRWTCGCALRRAMEAAVLKPDDVVLAACRDFDPEEVELVAREGWTMLGIGDVSRDPYSAGVTIAERLSGRPIHLSWDIDALDPAFAPGTEIPSPGGLSTRQGLDLLAGLAANGRLVGIDLVEVSPPLDQSGITVLAALKLIFEFWGHAWQPPT